MQQANQAERATRKEDSKDQQSFLKSAPAITLPKGGGAIRGMDEKFSANPVTGTGSMSLPIATSPGRSGFGPQLSISYDSGAGNGPFGFGWNLSLPSITRKTDKGLPQYIDAEDSDVFILSGAEDLVPVLVKQNGKWVNESVPDRTFGAYSYKIHRYRPRIEGLFARIERWTRTDKPEDVHWRSISKDNILTLYGFDAESRIADPEDSSRIFSWLICETRDDKGNAVLYRYKAEDGFGTNLSLASERNRGHRNDVRRTANRYLKRIYYGNREPLLDTTGHRPSFLTEAQISSANWMFEVAFDYNDHDLTNPRPKDDEIKDSTGTSKYPWAYRQDPFSSYRSGFEVRTTRLCQRVLMFHHFDGEAGVGKDCLVRSTDFTYSDEQNPSDARNPVYTFLRAVTQTGYSRSDNGYAKRSLPPVEFKYTQPIVQDSVQDVDNESLENLPIGVDGATYQWTDLHGEGIPGILSEQAGAWFYKRNLSPIGKQPVEFAPLERVAIQPNLALAGGAQFMDLAGDGQPDLVVMDGSMPGLYEHDTDEGWQPFRPFTSRLNRDMRDPNLKFIDLDGDGHADVLITEDEALVWHASLAEAGFAPAQRVAKVLDEEKGPRIVFADGTQSIYLADLSGDGLTDIVRIRNGEICYWPNLGYGHFGAKVTMNHAPHLDNSDQFDHKRIRLTDIDGSGTTDIIYLHRDGIHLYFNQSGNGWSAPRVLRVFPHMNDIVSIVPTDLFGNGTACLVWSSPLPGDARRQMRYVDLMGGQKPHLLVKTINNLGAETDVTYASSIKFYLQDKKNGKPWITRLPFPVHVVECVETRDYISRNRFVTRYAYHHGYFDGNEREFRGFGMVEQWDTEAFDVLRTSDTFPDATNIDDASHVPPVYTKTWFHTGVYIGRRHVSDFFAGLLNENDIGEYYREPGMIDAQAKKLLLPDTELPSGLTLDEEREACRALKGSMLRQEVYALDGTPKEEHPYTVSEQNFTIRPLQPHGKNRHAVFFTHPREAITYHYERNPVDPRVQHALTLEVDTYGNVLKSVAIGYGRRQGMSPLQDEDKNNQEQLLITYSENEPTVAIEDIAVFPDDYRTPLPCEARTWEVTGFKLAIDAVRFDLSEFSKNNFEPLLTLTKIEYEAPTDHTKKQKRLIECVRTLYRKDDLTGLLGKGELEPLALPGESYKLAFTPGLLDQVYVRDGQKLLPANPADVLQGGGADLGGYVDLDNNDNWWIPSGRMFYSPNSTDTAAQELAYARTHFFLPHRTRDPFHTGLISTESFVSYDTYDLLMIETRDALNNRVVVNENDYRVLQPRLISDPNGNQTAVVFDRLGMVAGTAVMGKPLPAAVEGDSLAGFATNLTQTQIDDFFDDPHTVAIALLQNATTRIIYDLDRFRRTQSANPADQSKWLPPYAATLARETHASDPLPPQGLKIQISFSYSDGFGREIQKKIQAEPEKINGVAGPLRWVGSGWTIFNNKGKPVRQYEPFFSQFPPGKRHHFEFGAKVGVSPILFYDPVERVVATLHPNHTYEKVVFDPWQQKTFDVNDTIQAPNTSPPLDPKDDPDVGQFFKRLPDDEYLPTWYDLRTDPIKAMQAWPDTDEQGRQLPDNIKRRLSERIAAQKAVAHADTPTTAHFDALGRPFLTLAHNRFKRNGAIIDEKYATRVKLDIEGNQREVIDAKDRIVMRYNYDMLGNRIHQLSMEAGARWMLNDVSGKPIRSWDSRGHNFQTGYDALRRAITQYVLGTSAESDPRTRNVNPLLIDKIEYGENLTIGVTTDQELNLRTRIYRHFDSAGIVTNERFDKDGKPIKPYDFKGNLLSSTRQLVSKYQSIPDWSQNPQPQLEDEIFTSSTRYDALNRSIQTVAPHSNLGNAKFNIIQPVFNEANLLEGVYVWLDHTNEPPALLNPDTETPSPVGINNIDYDAKGQRLRIDYKNGATTRYAYDPATFRLIQLYTRRSAAFNEDCDNPQPPPQTIPAPELPSTGTSCGLQNLHYTYDPVGNISQIRDDAHQPIYFRNKRVEPSNDYTYDAIYRLIEATGREHLGQIGGAPIPHSYNDKSRIGVDWSANDGNAMGTYIESYVYDAAGNFLEMQHRGNDPAHAGWKRTYRYNETSLVEDGTGGNVLKISNRLSNTNVGNGSPITEPYAYDVHGNMLQMPQLQIMQWDYKDQLQITQRQKINDEDTDGVERHGECTWYIYDTAGQRVRKVTELSDNSLKEERIYLGGFEIYRKHAGVHSGLQRETLHIMDDKQRIALVETRNDVIDGSPRQLVRYQFSNHLGSASLELDEQAQIISYEEYAPYGSSSYQAVRSQTETAKRYRYTDKERDEESGLYYHGARYYASWLGRWTACDPKGLDAGINAFSYVIDNPIRLFDPNGEDWRDSLSWTQKAALWIDDRIQESPVARGVVNNLDKRGRALANAPAAIAEKYQKEGLSGIGKSVVEGAVHLGKDTFDAAADVGYYGAKAYYEGDAEAKEKVASRSLDILLNVADLVTLADGAGAAKNAAVGGAKALAEGGKNLATTLKDVAAGGGMVTAEGVVVSGAETLAATADSGKILAVATDATKGTGLLMMEAKNAAGGGSTPKPKAPEHHIATNKNNVAAVRGGPWTPRFKKFFEGAGLDINTAKENLVSVLEHAGPHPEAYHQFVFDRLATATKGLKPNTPAFRDAVVATLEDIGKQAKTPGTQVNRWLTER